jgi:hypothetical protein
MLPSAKPAWWRSTTGAVIFAAVIAAALYLAFVHIDHVLKILPLLFILACPLMHIFMHRGRHGHGHGRPNDVKSLPHDPGHGETPDRGA